VPGIEVKFTASAGYLTGPIVITNAAGIATLDSWAIATVAGKSVVTAIAGAAPPVVFNMIGAPGPPAKIAKVEGDNNVGRPGLPVRPNPRVWVTDLFGNGIPSTTVKFSVVAGGGNIVGSDVVTDSLGFAAVGEWTLGAGGDQVLDAQAGELAPVKFVATVGIIPDIPCLSLIDLHAHSAVTSELGQQTCVNTDGHNFEAYLVRPVADKGSLITLESPDFDTFLELRDINGGIIATNDNRAGGVSNSVINAILPAGGFVAIATTARRDGGGRYTIRYETVDPSPGCDDLFIARGDSIEQRMIDKKCDDGRPSYVDRYKIYLRAGVPVSIQVDDKSYDDPTVVLMDDKGAVVANEIVQNYYHHLINNFSAPADGYYTFQVTAQDELINYILIVR
jgi:hypothetical protein